MVLFLFLRSILQTRPPEIKALVDRAGFVAKANGELFRHKVGAAVVAVGGLDHVFDSINIPLPSRR